MKNRQNTTLFCCCFEKKQKKTNKETNKKHHRFSIFIYFARMNFIVDPFAKIDNLSKMCNLGNSCKNPKENWQIFPIRQVKSTQKFPHALKAFPNFSFVCFHWKITWHLGKVNKKLILRERESQQLYWRPVLVFGFTNFSVPPCWLSKMTNKLLL